MLWASLYDNSAKIYSQFISSSIIVTHMLSWITGCLALKTRNCGLKNSFIPGGTLPTHPATPKKGEIWHDGFLTFLKEIHPRKIGIITELKRSYLEVSNDFSTKCNDTPLHYQVINEYHTKASILDTVEGIFVSNAHIILLSVYCAGVVWSL